MTYAGPRTSNCKQARRVPRGDAQPTVVEPCPTGFAGVGGVAWHDHAVTDPQPDPTPAPPATPDWWEDPDLAIAVAEIEEFVGTAGWDAAPQMFALVETATLLAAEPGLADSLDATARFTPIAQDPLPADELSDALAAISWPDEVAGCVLSQEIVVLPPTAEESLSADPAVAASEAATHPDRTEARLVAGVLRENGAACLLRLRDRDDQPLRGADLAPNLIAALRMTFAEDAAS